MFSLINLADQSWMNSHGPFIQQVSHDSYRGLRGGVLRLIVLNQGVLDALDVRFQVLFIDAPEIGDLGVVFIEQMLG